MHVHQSSPHFTADISAITGIKWSQRCQPLATLTLKAVIFPASWHGQRLMEDLASRTCLSPRIQWISLDDPWMILDQILNIQNIYSFGDLPSYRNYIIFESGG